MVSCRCGRFVAGGIAEVCGFLRSDRGGSAGMLSLLALGQMLSFAAPPRYGRGRSRSPFVRPAMITAIVKAKTSSRSVPGHCRYGTVTRRRYGPAWVRLGRQDAAGRISDRSAARVANPAACGFSPCPASRVVATAVALPHSGVPPACAAASGSHCRGLVASSVEPGREARRTDREVTIHLPPPCPRRPQSSA